MNERLGVTGAGVGIEPGITGGGDVGGAGGIAVGSGSGDSGEIGAASGIVLRLTGRQLAVKNSPRWAKGRA